MPTAQQFDAYIDQLMNEIKLIGDHDALWKTVPGINNSPGNLGLHIAGNLQHFIGSDLSAGTVFAVGEVRGTGELVLGTNAHQLQAFGPARDYTVERKFRRLATFN